MDRIFKRESILPVITLLLLSAGCTNSGGNEVTRAVGVNSTSVANLSAATPFGLRTSDLSPIVPTQVMATTTPATRSAPTPNNNTPVSDLVTYTDKKFRWQVMYPAKTLSAQQFNENVVIFISADRGTFVAVEYYTESASRYGNTGENLRNRARDTVDAIYGTPVNFAGIIDRPPKLWTTGFAFTTDKGSKGEAIYKQPTSIQPSFNVYGVIFGYKVNTEEQMLPILKAIRESFQETTKNFQE